MNQALSIRLLRQIQQKSFFSNMVLSRNISSSIPRKSGDYEYEDAKSEEDIVNITYITRDGTSKKVRGKVGDNVMYLAHRLAVFCSFSNWILQIKDITSKLKGRVKRHLPAALAMFMLMKIIIANCQRL